jgi:hypothetical protein
MSKEKPKISLTNIELCILRVASIIFLILLILKLLIVEIKSW